MSLATKLAIQKKKANFIKIAEQNGIPCSLYAHRLIDLGWTERRAATEPPSENEKLGNKYYNKRLMI